MGHEPSCEEIDEWLQTQAKAIVAYVFRNTFLEYIHANGRITDKEMKKLMKEWVNRMYTALKLQWDNYDAYMKFIGLNLTYTDRWDTPEIIAKDYEH